CDAVEDELDAIRRADLRHMVEHLLGPRPKLLRDERIPVLACRVSIWVQLEGPPVQLNLDVRALGKGAVQPPLADVTPGEIGRASCRERAESGEARVGITRREGEVNT